jgi:hypothetical protein
VVDVFARAACSLLMIGIVGACTPAAAGPFSPFVGITNATTVPITIRANGSVEREVGPGSEVELPIGDLPPPPWSIDALSPTGRVLLSLEVPASDVNRDRPTGEGAEIRGDASFVELSCGRIDLNYGPPALGPAQESPVGRPGDCD